MKYAKKRRNRTDPSVRAKQWKRDMRFGTWVFNACKKFVFILSEKRRLKVFENRVLRKVFGPKRGEVTGEWRRLHNNELYALYSSPDIIRVIKSRRLKCAGNIARMGERRGAYRV